MHGGAISPSMYFCPDILNTFLIAHFAVSKIYNQDARFPSVLYTMFPKYPQPYDVIKMVLLFLVSLNHKQMSQALCASRGLCEATSVQHFN